MSNDKIVGGKHYTKIDGVWFLVNGYHIDTISAERNIMVEQFECEDFWYD